MEKKINKIASLLYTIFQGCHHYTGWDDMVAHNEDEIQDFIDWYEKGMPEENGK